MTPTLPDGAETAFLTAAELAARWRSDVQTLANWRVDGRGPAWFKPEGKILYPVSEVLAWERRLKGWTREGVAAAVETFKGLDAETRRKLLKHIERTVTQ